MFSIRRKSCRDRPENRRDRCAAQVMGFEAKVSGARAESSCNCAKVLLAAASNLLTLLEISFHEFELMV